MHSHTFGEQFQETRRGTHFKNQFYGLEDAIKIWQYLLCILRGYYSELSQNSSGIKTLVVSCPRCSEYFHDLFSVSQDFPFSYCKASFVLLIKFSDHIRGVPTF